MNIPELVKKQNGFSDFNPVQKKALQADLFNQNTIIASPTASGKTVIAELCALDSIINKHQKVVYTCPLRALASEHYSGFKKKYADFKVRTALSTGELDSSSKYLSNYDFIFCTNEKLDSLIRHKADWLQQVGLLVIDEVHLLGSDRGPTLEMVIAKMQLVNPKIRLLALSATIPNAKQISEWLKAKLVKSDYRPVKLEEGVFFDDKLVFSKRSQKIQSKERDPLSQLTDNTLNQEDQQCLVFANSRRGSQSMAKKMSRLTALNLTPKKQEVLNRVSQSILSALEQPTSQCMELAELVKRGIAFHHAGLLQKQRQLVEEAFKKDFIKVICATPTLALGVNIPAFRVIVPSLYRYTNSGNQRISVSEYKQLCLPYATRVFTENFGEIEIGRVVEEKLSCKVLSWNEKMKKIEFKQVVKHFKRKTKNLVELTTELGNKIRLTPNHLALIREKNHFVWKSAKDLKKTIKLVHLKKFCGTFSSPPFFIDLLPLRDVYVLERGNLIIEAKKKLKLTEKKLASELKASYKSIYGWKKNKKAMHLEKVLKLCDLLGYSKKKRVKLIRKIKTRFGTPTIIPATVNEDFLWLAGFIAADGNINFSTDKRYKSEYATIRVFNKNKKLIKKADKILNRFGLFPYLSKREDGLITLEVGATLLSKVLSRYFGIPAGNKTFTVTVPSFLLGLREPFIGAYLGGVFDGDGNYNEARQRYGSKVRRVLFVTGSKAFANGIQQLLFRLGILSKVFKERKKTTVFLNKQIVVFKKPRFHVIFRKIEFLKRFQKYAKITKCKIDASYSNYHNIKDFHDWSNEDVSLVSITKKRNLMKETTVYNLKVQGNENYFADRVLVHNCGRAGRPSFHERGESILIAHSELEADELLEFFVKGELENIESQLSREPVLRTHLLAAIATNFIFDLQSLEEFFSKTFFAFQYKNTSALFEQLSAILSELQELGFVKGDEKRFTATPLGKRVAELYLDPLAAHALIQSLKQNRIFSPLTYLFLFVQTNELYPLVSLPKKKEPEVLEELMLSKDEIPAIVERELYSDHNFSRKFFTARMLEEWINEKPEPLLSEEFNTAPGLLHSKLWVCDWLGYSSFELCRLLGLEKHLSKLRNLRKRLKFGVKEELLLLVEVKGIGRVRARKLWNNNIRSVTELKKTDIKDLSRLLGETVAFKIKQNLGQKTEKTFPLPKQKEQSSLKVFD